MIFKCAIALLIGSSAAYAQKFPETPPNACYEGCTAKMQDILKKFESAAAPSLEPAVYSGECYHLGASYDANHTHYGTMMFDQNLSQPYFAMIFSFFLTHDDSADWDLKKAEVTFDPEWKNYGRDVYVASNTARVEIANGETPYMIYWMKQDPASKTIYQITYWGGVADKSFCEFKKH